MTWRCENAARPSLCPDGTPAPSLPPRLPGEGGEAAMNLCHVSLRAHAIKLADSDLHRAGKRVYVRRLRRITDRMLVMPRFKRGIQ
jgi:hypothetical protein